MLALIYCILQVSTFSPFVVYQTTVNRLACADVASGGTDQCFGASIVVVAGRYQSQDCLFVHSLATWDGRMELRDDSLQRFDWGSAWKTRVSLLAYDRLFCLGEHSLPANMTLNSVCVQIKNTCRKQVDMFPYSWADLPNQQITCLAKRAVIINWCYYMKSI